MPSASSITLGERYVLVERIGIGGFSEVWRAHDRVLDRAVAVKLLDSSFAGHEETLRRFRAEARHAAALSHENIARVYDYGDPSQEHPPYLVMELVEGDSLAHMLRVGGAMDAERVMDITAQAAAGLQAAHQAGLVHRDVKPANLLVSAGGVVRITDFGISYAAGSAPMTRTGMIIGTPSYLAPERTSGAQATQASDLYALGVVAYECLTGKPPFAGTAIEVALAHRERPFPPLPASVPGAVAGFVGNLTAKDPADRPATAAEVAATASGLRDQLRTGHRAPAASIAPPLLPPVSHRRTPAPTELLAQPPARGRPSRRVVLGLAGAVVAAALIALAGVDLLGAAFSHHASGVPPKASSVTATGVNVNGQALIGLPVGVAVRELNQLRLRVRVRWQMAPGQPRGRVVAVEPTGRVLVGSLITVTGTERPPGKGHGKDKGHDHGHGHGDGGGGDGGDGN